MAMRVTRRAGAAVLVALALAASGAACTDDPAPVRLELSETDVRPSQVLELRVIAPGEHFYGTVAIIERLGPGERWAPAYRTRVVEDGEGTDYARYDDQRWGTFPVGLSGDQWWTIGLPGQLQPGRYRITMDLVLGREKAQTVVHSEDLVVTS